MGPIKSLVPHYIMLLAFMRMWRLAYMVTWHLVCNVSAESHSAKCDEMSPYRAGPDKHHAVFTTGDVCRLRSHNAL